MRLRPWRKPYSERTYQWASTGKEQRGELASPHGPWPAPQRVAIATHGRWSCLALFGAILIGNLVHGDPSNYQLLWFALCGVAGLYAWLGRTGWVTIDPTARTISWQRPGRIDHVARSWSFDDVDSVSLKTSLLRIQTLKLKVGGRRFSLRTSGEGSRLLGALHPNNAPPAASEVPLASDAPA